jgi:monoamine oxidase
MPPFTRRTFLAASAATAAGPTFAAPAPSSGEVDVVIVGAGAAGIAAARKCVAAGRRVAVIEAAERIGGRCITDTTTFGVPFDRGAHWIHTPDLNPVAKLAPQSGLDVYAAPPGQKIRIGRRNAREGEMEDFFAALVRAQRAIAEAGRGKVDITGLQALPKDLGDWRPTVEFVLGPFGCGKDLRDISAFDFARSSERDVDAFCRQGLGALVARLAGGLAVQLATPVTRIESRAGGRVEVTTARGRFGAAAVIVTVSNGVLAAGKIRFDPEPKRQLEAAAKLSLGSYDHVALEIAGNPLGLQRDELVYEKTDGARTAAMLANVSGSPLHMVELAGKFGRDLSGQGEAAMKAFALDWLTALYGNDIRKAVSRSVVTRWNEEPWALGAFSAAPPGSQPLRRALMETVRERIFFAGEAAHETLWGTVGGAWESGERAADAALKLWRPASPPAARGKGAPQKAKPRPRERDAWPYGR